MIRPVDAQQPNIVFPHRDRSLQTEIHRPYGTFVVNEAMVQEEASKLKKCSNIQVYSTFDKVSELVIRSRSKQDSRFISWEHHGWAD